MAHLSPTNTQPNSMVTPTNNVRGNNGIQSLTIETGGSAHQHPSQMIPTSTTTTGATSPVNAANNP